MIRLYFNAGLEMHNMDDDCLEFCKMEDASSRMY